MTITSTQLLQVSSHLAPRSFFETTVTRKGQRYHPTVDDPGKPICLFRRCALSFLRWAI